MRGVQTDLGSYIGQSVELETRASELSAAAYDEQRDKGKRIDPSCIARQHRTQRGQGSGVRPGACAEGLQSFVGKTGDLATGQAALLASAKLARATGTSLEDMVGSAGEAAKALGDVGPGKEFRNGGRQGHGFGQRPFGSWPVKARLARSNSKTWPSTAAVSRLLRKRSAAMPHRILATWAP